MIDHLNDETPGSDYIRGRGALSNNGSRFQPLKSVYADGADRPAATTRYRPVQARSIIARNLRGFRMPEPLRLAHLFVNKYKRKKDKDNENGRNRRAVVPA